MSELNGYSELLMTLLSNRGITTRESAEVFLNPDYDAHTHDPTELAGMDAAVERIRQAMADDEHTVIFADYDTDGIPGAVILHDTFNKLGYQNFSVYIPHRNKEGFGLNTGAIEGFIEDGVNLLVTVDCGIGNVEEIRKARDGGIDVVVTDHHLPNGQLPQANAIVNPKREDCAYPFPDLCGAGVAYKVAQALLGALRTDGEIDASAIPEGWEKWLLDMVAIATVSDMVPLVGENRVLAYWGLRVLRKSPRPGLLALLKKTRTSQKYLDEEDIGFVIGPRINAASRMGIPMDAFRLLATDDDDEAARLAEHLQKINDKRKGMVAAMVKEIRAKITKRSEMAPVIVTGDPHWKPSLLGLAAHSLTDEFERPVFLWGREAGTTLKGSCRSDGSVSVVELMSQVRDEVFLEFGGHHASGGFTVSKEHVHTLEEYLSEAYELVDVGVRNKNQSIEADLALAEVTWSLYDQLKRLAPFGKENPRPLFRFGDVSPKSIEHFGKRNNHLKLIFSTDSGTIEAIQFFATADDYADVLDAGRPIDVHAHVEKSTFGYKPTLRLRIVDITNSQ